MVVVGNFDINVELAESFWSGHESIMRLIFPESTYLKLYVAVYIIQSSRLCRLKNFFQTQFTLVVLTDITVLGLCGSKDGLS